MNNFEKINNKPQTKEGEKAEIKEIASLDLKKEIGNLLGIEKNKDISILARIDEVVNICDNNKIIFNNICNNGLPINIRVA